MLVILTKEKALKNNVGGEDWENVESGISYIRHLCSKRKEKSYLDVISDKPEFCDYCNTGPPDYIQLAQKLKVHTIECGKPFI